MTKRPKIEVRRIARELERYQKSALLSKPSIRLKNYLLKTDKQALPQFSCKPFQHQKNERANSQKVLLADTTKRR